MSSPELAVSFVDRTDKSTVERNCSLLISEMSELSGDDFRAKIRRLREIHLRLFERSSVEDRHFFGKFRGDSIETRIDHAYICLKFGERLSRHQKLIHVDKIADSMKLLDDLIDLILSRELPIDQVFPLLVKFSYTFLLIHPFVDGNGHVFRVLIALLARRTGLYISHDWSLVTRPYSQSFTIAMINYPLDPLLLFGVLSRWIGPAARTFDLAPELL